MSGAPKEQISGESTLERIMGERRDKAQKLASAGEHPYRNDFKPTSAIKVVRDKYEAIEIPPRGDARGLPLVDGDTLRLAGRVMARRGMGKTVFVPIRDGSGQIQLFININESDQASFENVLPLLDVGDIIGAEGQAFWTQRGELSIVVRKLTIITKSLMPLPDKHKGLTDVEIRYRQRYLDLVVNQEVREVFRKRTRIVSELRHFLDSRDFIEVETPMMHPIVGGAAARPFATHHNALDMPLYMRIAPELYLKRLVVGGFDRVYELNRSFRNEGLSRSHNPEFTMLEFYWAYATYCELMDLTEEMLSSVAGAVNGHNKIHWYGHDVELDRPWRRLSIKEALVKRAGQSPEIFDSAEKAAEAAIASGVSPHEVIQRLLESLSEEALAKVDTAAVMARFAKPEERPDLCKTILDTYAEGVERICAGGLAFLIFEEKVEQTLIEPTFLTDYPLALSPLARAKEGDPAFCDRFELFVCGKEVANGFSELNDPCEQRRRFEDQVRAKKATGAEETMDYDEDYCRALELGMPPAAGEGIGIDRLVMLLTGQDSIRDVILFPLMRPE